MKSELQKSLQASGTGNNEISQQMTGGSSSLQSSLRSQGSLDISSSGYASADSASLGVGIAAQDEDRRRLAQRRVAASAGPVPRPR